jgi:hypothetical protein
MGSEKMTRVTAPGRPLTRPGLMLRGHVTWREAVDEFKRHLEGQLAEAQAGLAAIEAGTVQVRHQRGIHRVTDVRPVPRPDTPATPAKPHYVSLGVTDDEVARGDDYGRYDFPGLLGSI